MLLTSTVVALLLNASVLTSHVAHRRTARIQQAQTRAMTVRIGRDIRPATISPRRMQLTWDATVTGIIDGSVIIVERNDGRESVVRLFGSDSPLLLQNSLKDECFANEAMNALGNLLVGQHVSLEEDQSYRNDNENRVLMYVRFGGLDVNAWMIENGYAYADDRNDYARKSQYLELQDEAQHDERGLWSGICDYNATPKHRIQILP